MKIERKLGEIIVIKCENKLTRDTAERIRYEVMRCIENQLPIILDNDMTIETICTPETMHRDYSQRFGDTA